MSTKCQNPKCRKTIHIQIRLGGQSCSLDCDRVLGIGKYADEKPFESEKLNLDNQHTGQFRRGSKRKGKK